MSIDVINKIAYDAAQAFLMNKSDLTDFIKTAAVSNDLNPEEIKRVCEKANQNTYLGLFHDANTDRANIFFKLADFDEISSNISREDIAMNDYDVTPQDYRLAGEKIAAEFEASAEDIARERHEVMQKVAAYRDRLVLMRRSVETIKVAGIRDAESAVGQIHDLCRSMVVNGESMGDITKIACRNVMGAGFGYEKTASAFAEVADAIASEGLVVKTEFTKVSSTPAINAKHPVNTAAMAFASEVEKTAAAEEFIANVDRHIAKLDSILVAAETV